MHEVTLIKAETERLQNECFVIRKKVFIEEQSVPFDLERDDLDAIAIHYLLSFENNFVATARWYKDGHNAHIGRVAVLKEYRGKNFGKQIIEKSIEDIRNGYKMKGVVLASQVQAKEFYEKIGFKEFGNEFIEAGILHVNMILNF